MTTDSVRTYPIAGSLLVLIGVSGLIFAGLSSTNALPFMMPAFWFQTRAIFLLLFIGAIIGGSSLIWKAEHGLAHTQWRPTWPGQRFETVTLYTRSECGLCDEAVELLAQYTAYLPHIEELDIDSDESLTEKFNTCVPVVEIDGRIRFRGRISEALLQRLIEATPPQM